MTEPTHGTTLAEQRIRTLLAELPAATRNLGGQIVYSDAFRSQEWPHKGYALTRADLEAVLALLDQARSLRLARPADAVDPAVHTPERVRARLERLGWTWEGGGRVAEIWHPHADVDRKVAVALIPTAPDYAKVTGLLASDLAELYGVGELQVLAGIAAAEPMNVGTSAPGSNETGSSDGGRNADG